MKRILIVFGTRPEAIKMAPVVKAIQAAPNLDLRVCVTAQQREMLDQVLKLFEIEPEYDLDLMTHDQTLHALTAKVLVALEKVFEDYRPDLVMVHGDTTTSMAAALSAFYQRIAVSHVEAGLRTRNIYSPWPEELNRQITGRITRIHFAPTELSKQNLLDELVPARDIVVTGNTVIDALLTIRDKITASQQLSEDLARRFDYLNAERRLVLVTGHRRENFGNGFQKICEAIKLISARPDVEVLYPVHLNPNVHGPVTEILGNIENIHLIEPQPYLSFVYLMNRAHLILTDSGGIQEEAPSFGKPVLVMRDNTERPEGVDEGTVRLVGTDSQRICSELQTLLDDSAAYHAMAKAHNPYGDGKASSRIVDSLSRIEF